MNRASYITIRVTLRERIIYKTLIKLAGQRTIITCILVEEARPVGSCNGQIFSVSIEIKLPVKDFIDVSFEDFIDVTFDQCRFARRPGTVRGEKIRPS